MAKATTKPVDAQPDVVLEMTHDEAQTLRDVLGWSVSGDKDGRRRHISHIFNALITVIPSSLTNSDFKGQAFFIR